MRIPADIEVSIRKAINYRNKADEELSRVIDHYHAVIIDDDIFSDFCYDCLRDLATGETSAEKTISAIKDYVPRGYENE